MTTDNARAKLYAKLLKAQTAASAVEKKGRNTEQGYAYAQASDVIEEAQRALHEAGLVGFMVPHEGEVEQTELQARSGAAGLFVTLVASLRIADPDTGEEIELSFRGTGIDYPGDKAIYKAMTGAAKYAYASVLGIPFGDDPEADTAGAAQPREPRTSGVEASPAQKRAITTIMNRAGVAKEFQREIVHALAGDPPTKTGASAILDEIAGDTADDPAALKAAIARLVDRAGVQPPSDIPADVLPDDTAAHDAAEEGDGLFPPADDEEQSA